MFQVIVSFVHNDRMYHVLDSGQVVTIKNDVTVKSTAITATVSYGIGGNGGYGWTVRVCEHGKHLKTFSVGA